MYTEVKSILLNKFFHHCEISSGYNNRSLCPYCETQLESKQVLQFIGDGDQSAVYLICRDNEYFRREYESFGNLDIEKRLLQTGLHGASGGIASREHWDGPEYVPFPYELRFAQRPGLVLLKCASRDYDPMATEMDGSWPVYSDRGCPSEYYVLPPGDGENVLYFYSRLGNMLCAIDKETTADAETMRELEYLEYIAPNVFRILPTVDRVGFRCPLCNHMIRYENRSILADTAVAPYLTISAARRAMLASGRELKRKEYPTFTRPEIASGSLSLKPKPEWADSAFGYDLTNVYSPSSKRKLNWRLVEEFGCYSPLADTKGALADYREQDRDNPQMMDPEVVKSSRETRDFYRDRIPVWFDEIKLTLRYALTVTKDEASPDPVAWEHMQRFYLAPAIMSLPSPDNPRGYFLWLWHVWFPKEDFHLANPDEYELVSLSCPGGRYEEWLQVKTWDDPYWDWKIGGFKSYL